MPLRAGRDRRRTKVGPLRRQARHLRFCRVRAATEPSWGMKVADDGGVQKNQMASLQSRPRGILTSCRDSAEVLVSRVLTTWTRNCGNICGNGEELRPRK